MIEQVNGFITPMKEWNAVGKNDETKFISYIDACCYGVACLFAGG